MFKGNYQTPLTPLAFLPILFLCVGLPYSIYCPLFFHYDNYGFSSGPYFPHCGSFFLILPPIPSCYLYWTNINSYSPIPRSDLWLFPVIIFCRQSFFWSYLPYSCWSYHYSHSQWILSLIEGVGVSKSDRPLSVPRLMWLIMCTCVLLVLTCPYMFVRIAHSAVIRVHLCTPKIPSQSQLPQTPQLGRQAKQYISLLWA